MWEISETSRAILCCDVETWEKNNTSTSYKSCIFWILKANHLEARDSDYSIVSWHKKQRYSNKKLDSHLHDYWLCALIMCCVPECLNIVYRNKRLKTRRAFPNRILVMRVVLIRALTGAPESLKSSGRNLAGHFTDVYSIGLRGRNLSTSPSIYWTWL